MFRELNLSPAKTSRTPQPPLGSQPGHLVAGRSGEGRGGARHGRVLHTLSTVQILPNTDQNSGKIADRPAFLRAITHWHSTAQPHPQPPTCPSFQGPGSHSPVQVYSHSSCCFSPMLMSIDGDGDGDGDEPLPVRACTALHNVPHETPTFGNVA